MTTSLADLISQRADELAKEQPSREERLHEWREAVDALFEQFAQWIRGADAKQITQACRASVARYERSLGAYPGERLVISLAGDDVVFETGARTVGASGMIDDETDPRPLTGRVDVRYGEVVVESLYRVGAGSESHWVVRRHSLDREFRFLSLTRERFEQILVDVLQ